MQDSNNTPIQLYHHLPHPHAIFSISAANIQYYFSMLSTLPIYNKPNLSPIYVSQQQSNSVKWQRKRKCRDKDWVSDTENKPKMVSTYITPTNLLEKMGTNFKIHCLIPSDILKMPDESQEYLRLYCFKTPLSDSMPKGSNIKPFTFIYGNPLNQQIF